MKVRNHQGTNEVRLHPSTYLGTFVEFPDSVDGPTQHPPEFHSSLSSCSKGARKQNAIVLDSLAAGFCFGPGKVSGIGRDIAAFDTHGGGVVRFFRI